MKTHILFILSLIASISIYAQTSIVFVDKTNVREKPNIKSKVIGTLQAKTIVDIQDRWSREDSIGGHSAYWIKIKYKDKTAYVWERTLSFGSCRSQLNVDITFMAGYLADGKIGIKAFKKDSLISSIVYTPLNNSKYYTLKSIGKTYNSNEKEILVLKDGANQNSLFEWDGKSLKPSSITLANENFPSIDDFHPRKETNYEFCIIKKQNVNIRLEPCINSSIVVTLKQFTKVKLIKKYIKCDTVNGQRGDWNYIEWNNKKGYIWDDLMSIPVSYIKSNKNKNVAFLYTVGAIYVFENDNVIHQSIIEKDYHVESFFEMGNMGLEGDYQFLGAEVVGYTEGIAMGTKIYLWDGKKIKYIGFDGGSGDIGEYYDFSLQFPISTGIKNKIRSSNDFFMEFAYPLNDTINDNAKYFVIKENPKIMELRNDTLVEIPSKHSRIREFVKKNYPGNTLKHSTFGDINQDGIEDAICLITKEYLDSNEGYYKITKTIVAIAFGKEDNSYYLYSANSSIVDKSFQAVDFELNNENITISIIYTSSDYQGYITKLTKYQFHYNRSDNTIIWESITEGENNEANYTDYNTPWEISTKKFRETKFLFDKAWSNPDFLRDNN
jgi:uncharacterized protein YgiM (DUF1202 family)